VIGASTARWRRRCALLTSTLLALSACSAVRVREADGPIDRAIGRDDSVAVSLSYASLAVVQARGARARDCVHRPDACFEQRTVVDKPDLEAAVAEAEVRLATARVAETESDAAHWRDVAASYLEAARVSYAYFSFAGRLPAGRALEAQRNALRAVYDAATESFAQALFAHRDDRSTDGLRAGSLRLPHWHVRLGIDDVRLPPGQSRAAELVTASLLRFDGIRTVHRREGWGAAFVAVASPPVERAHAPLIEAQFLPATVVLRFAGRTLDEMLNASTVEIDVRDPTSASRVRIGMEDVPLAANFTAPYALWLARSNFERQAGFALLRASSRLDGPRVYAMQPYDPNRQTVVLLHGLGSSPATWANLVNDMMGDDELRARYQLWQVFYPTNLPLAESQRTIRAALTKAFAAVDPKGVDPASSRVTLIGHSMGGVIARLLVVDSGDTLWRGLFGTGLATLAPDDVERLEPYLTLKPLPQVDTAIFVAAPHRGTPAADTWRGRLATHFVRLPMSLIELVASLSTLIDRQRDDIKLPKRPTSIETLRGQSFYLQGTSTLPIAAGVTYHTIVGRTGDAVTLEESSDGLVPYSSAHLSGAASELVVAADHHVHDTPSAIFEIKRILRERLDLAAGQNR
jgi:pimeloyl-ACP methyl ester carboxylesterase